ncbi:3'-5' exonuclease [Magnetospira sp. QH-2]|uniref:3'-5' exonuclease n=1 Tax=Magnetospira sp. (strain QH-2) TaxID=1288970 RepID=UPI0003E80CED|nr:3'-5' exonuclease [Magnetospira sp. QH-2]CCQ74072.1 Inhibitor of the KinA pathway to sporulation, predicted exonuclease [Magnetospira sp. QH-2]
MNAPFPTHGDLVIYDLEFTAWAGSAESKWTRPGEYMEVVQIGAVRVDPSDGLREKDQLSIYSHPIRNPQLSGYFIDLTGITQAQLDAEGLSYKEALDAFLTFGAGAVAWIANGWDFEVIKKNCTLHGLPVPDLPIHDVSHWLAAAVSRSGHVDSNTFGSILDLPKEGPAHDGLADARMIAAALRKLLGFA